MSGLALGLAAVAVLALLACHTWFGPDLWFHIAWGRAIWEQGRSLPQMPVLMKGPYACNQYWLFQTIVNGAFRIGGLPLTTLLFVALWVAIGLIWLRLGRLYRYPVLGPCFLLLFIAGVHFRLEYRPETFSFFFTSLFLLLLTEDWRRWTVPALTLLTIVWANCHSYFIFAPGLALAYALFTPGRLRAGLLLTALCLASSLVNPYAWEIWESIRLTVKLMRELGSGLEELTPTYRYAWWIWPMPVFWGYLAFLLAAAFPALRSPGTRFAAIIGLGAGVVGLRSFRFMPVMMILSGPLVRVTLQALGARLKPAVPALWTRAGSAIMAVTIFTLAAWILSGDFHRWIDSGTRPGFGLEWAEYPIGAAEFLQRQKFEGRLFNEATDGGYLEYHTPGVKLTCDSNYTDASVAQTYFAALTDWSAFQALNAQHGYDAALVNVTNTALAIPLLASPDWVTAYSDSHRILFVGKARFAAWARPLSADSHYRGDDLRRPEYRLQPAMWMSLALLRGDLAWARALIAEFEGAPAVPAGFTKLALQFAATQHDPDLTARALHLYEKTFGGEGDPELATALANLRPSSP